ncbi:hypothetical protein EB796_009684 [Bugula neritina]|uniref:Uncharacterized protein n=1 Tax=Bugula neritina TaxID=10212 RepID=A0A7J7K241_BUGNE|nr:hypothetical protein EB796_009684 [Bugula neritina]
MPSYDFIYFETVVDLVILLVLHFKFLIQPFLYYKIYFTIWHYTTYFSACRFHHQNYYSTKIGHRFLISCSFQI